MRLLWWELLRWPIGTKQKHKIENRITKPKTESQNRKQHITKYKTKSQNPKTESQNTNSVSSRGFESLCVDICMVIQGDHFYLLRKICTEFGFWSRVEGRKSRVEGNMSRVLKKKN